MSSDFMDDFVVLCDECWTLVQSYKDHFVRPEHRETVDYLMDMVRTPRRPFAEYVRALPDGFSACECCDGRGVSFVTFSDEEYDAMFGFDDPLDHYGE